MFARYWKDTLSLKDELTRLPLTLAGTAKSKTFRTADMEMYLPGFATATQ